MAVERLSGGLPIRRDPVEFDERGPFDEPAWWESIDSIPRDVPRSTLAWSTILLGIMLGLVAWCILGALAFVVFT